MLTMGKTWRSDYARFRFCDNGQQYVITCTKRGRYSIYRLAGYAPKGEGVRAEVWSKVTDATEQADALNEIARFYDRDPRFLALMGQAA